MDPPRNELRASLEAQEHRLHTLQEELAEESRLADIGEMFGRVAHEINNFLNLVLLHLAVLERELPENLRLELGEMRRQGMTVAGLVKKLQQARKSSPPVFRVVQMNQLLAEILEELAREPAPARGATVRLCLDPDLPAVQTATTQIKRLCTFLLSNALAAAAVDNGAVIVRSERAGDSVRLRIEDSGPALAPDLLHRMFESCIPARIGTNSLELAACAALARRLRGKLHGENLGASGFAVTLEVPIEPG